MLDGNDLKSIRENAGISQSDMAKKLDCDRRTIINYEQGVCEPKSSQLFNWLNACKIDVKPLLSQIHHLKESILLLFTIPFISTELISSVYLVFLGLCVIYGSIRKAINITHIAAILTIIYTVEYTITAFLTYELKILAASKLFIANTHFGFQICMSTIAIFLLKKRVKISIFISKSAHISQTFLDHVTPYIYGYHILIISLLFIDYNLDFYYKFKKLYFIYENFEQLMFISMLTVIWCLVAMIISHEKMLRKANNNARW